MNFKVKSVQILLIFLISATFGGEEPLNTASEQANDSTIQYPSLKGTAFAIMPGVLLHGVGHYMSGSRTEGKQLLKVSGISLATTVAGIGGLALTGANEKFSWALIPISFFGVGTFTATWLFDIIGVSGAANGPLTEHPYQETYFHLGYVSQDNNRNPLSSFTDVQAQAGFEQFFLRLNLERENSGRFFEWDLAGGYRLMEKEKWRFYIIPEIKQKFSSEGFRISQGHLLAEFELMMGKIWPTLNGVLFFSELGYGLELFHFDGMDIDYRNKIMIIGQGIRLQLSEYLDVSTRYKRREDEMIGGRDYNLFYFEHGLRIDHNHLFGRVLFTHGQGYRLKFSAGYAL